MDRHFYHTTDVDIIGRILSSKSSSIMSIIEDSNAVFSLWYKDIKHADLINSGKSSPNKYRLVKGQKVLKKRISPEYEKNVLNYLTVGEMKRIANKSNKAFPTAHQSNIHVSEDFLRELGVTDNVRSIPENTSFFLVNDTLSYFTQHYTSLVATTLGKNIANCKGKDIVLSDELFTPISMSVAAHGIGTSKDVVFHDLRHNIFTADRIYFLIKRLSSKTTVYILLDKNPIFYKIAEQKNTAWIKYLQRVRQHEDQNIKAHELLSETTTRSLQSEWKDNLAREMMTQTDHDNEVFCPLTRITADYDKVSTLFRASHIVSFKDSEIEQKYDLYNGMLLCANADALFDKHLISINENKQLVFSFLIDNNKLLKERLLLNQGVYKEILTPQRMAYLKQHYIIFLNKEKIRKQSPDYIDYE